MTSKNILCNGQAFEEYIFENEPYYVPTGNEIEIFTAAYKNNLPVNLKGPTGCGKTRFMEYMAYHLNRPLITVACHEDLTATDLIGRFIIKGGDVEWNDGPLTKAVKNGAICYLDEVVEARTDTLVVIHPLTDERRILPIDKQGIVLKAKPEFMLSISYNPGYQSVIKDLKQSTRQRFIAIEFNYPSMNTETQIVAHESGVSQNTAHSLVEIGHRIRNFKQHGLEEGISTRLLIYAGKLINEGIAPNTACRSAMIEPITDDFDLQMSISEIISAVLEWE
ncbi:CbbQ/NirQ/NorQ domain protein [Methanohalobium evestigatum Z-7303]|uniref:CbbQ/NirQ/NorQ domain protein n=1 Tax=Methanohalobium evestigatum (strain ATCC BAA-1072 / DSM 3721 / NBRC 107634 / OCM 161 / Z-7303) TaxID=644295 RepID=D7E7X8_METEZ|nr:CbbQ/NirQ/NorQ/GpvN family protein [Methanohalobium evestigatum]ADI73320.1 CbbQ/NirQ/NorQ domain protein [Methanohalobium evestigatum Z-7303]